MLKRTILLALLLAGAALAPGAGAAAPVATGVITGPSWLLSLPYTIDAHFGSSLAIADFDRDGYGDLAVGAPGDLVDRVRAGRVYVYPGGPHGPLQARPTDRPRAFGAAAGDDFGAALATGDLTGDGYPDLVAGAPGAGAIVVFQGGPGGLSGPAERRGAPGDRFGATLAVGDFDRDGYADVAVGAPGRDEGAGAVFVFPGGFPGGPTHRSVLVTQGKHGGVSEPGDHFGVALAAGDFDGDGYADLAVGAPDEAPGRGARGGAVTVLRGSRHGLRGGHVLIQAAAGGVVEAGDRFGAALAAGDLDGDRRAELLVGAPGEGAAHVFRGEHGRHIQPIRPIRLTQPNGGGFGTALPSAAQVRSSSARQPPKRPRASPVPSKMDNQSPSRTSACPSSRAAGWAPRSPPATSPATGGPRSPSPDRTCSSPACAVRARCGSPRSRRMKDRHEGPA